MNILKCLLVVIALFAISCKVTNGQNQMASISLYQFNSDQCSGSTSESGDATSCSTSNIATQIYAELNTCVIFGGEFVIFSLVSTNSNSNINMTTYDLEGCQGKIIESEIVQQNQCTMNCKNAMGSNPYLISVIDSSDIEIPTNSFVVAYYPGVCNGDWKSNSALVEVSALDLCVNESPNNSVKLSCNPFINILTVESFKSNNCQGSPNNATIPVTTGCNNINGLNMQLVCTNHQ